MKIASHLDRARAHLFELFETGLYPSLQVCVRHRGQIVLHEAMGRHRPVGEPTRWDQTTTQTRYMLFSISKSVTSMVMHLLFERGQLHVDDPVHWYIPEFGQRGKEHVTLRHILTHTAGIPMWTWRLTDELILDWDRIISQLCASRPLHFPGRIAGYHLLSGGYILGEVIQRVTQKGLREVLTEEFLEPLGFETFNYGIDASWYDRTACSERVDPLPPAPLVQALNRVVQMDMVQALAVMNRPAVFESVIPAGNIVGTAEEVSRFFELLRCGGELDGRRVISQAQVRRATVEQVLTRHDFTLFLMPMRYSLGFMLGRKNTELNIFGRNTEQAFGHLGFTRNLGWADPARDLAVGFLTSSKVTWPRKETLLLRRFQNALCRAFE